MKGLTVVLHLANSSTVGVVQHMLALVDSEGKVFGGHLNRAVVSATCEMVINVIDGVVDRVFDNETGLNIFKF